MEEKRPKFPVDSEESHRIMIEALEMVGFTVSKPKLGEKGGIFYRDENDETKRWNPMADKPVQPESICLVL